MLMSEPDHIWLKPMPNLMTGDIPAAFPFFYIEPAKPDYRPITEKFTGKLTLKQAESIAPIGMPSKVLTHITYEGQCCKHGAQQGGPNMQANLVSA